MKRVRGTERIAALAAISTARQKHRHVGIRPARHSATSLTPGAYVPPNHNAGRSLDQAVNAATSTWPDNDDWEVFGAQNFSGAQWPQDCEQGGDGCFYGPTPYGMFHTESEDDWREQTGMGPSGA